MCNLGSIAPSHHLSFKVDCKEYLFGMLFLVWSLSQTLGANKTGLLRINKNFQRGQPKCRRNFFKSSQTWFCSKYIQVKLLTKILNTSDRSICLNGSGVFTATENRKLIYIYMIRKSFWKHVVIFLYLVILFYLIIRIPYRIGYLHAWEITWVEYFSFGKAKTLWNVISFIYLFN